MKKIAMVIGILSIFATSANAVTRDNSYMSTMSNPSYSSSGPSVIIIY